MKITLSKKQWELIGKKAGWSELPPEETLPPILKGFKRYKIIDKESGKIANRQVASSPEKAWAKFVTQVFRGSVLKPNPNDYEIKE